MTDKHNNVDALAALDDCFFRLPSAGKCVDMKKAYTFLEHYGETIRAALQKQDDDWQDISTAPKDGTRIREELTSIKQMAADMEVVANFLGMKGRFESDIVKISISDLANIIRGKDFYPINRHKFTQHNDAVLSYHADDQEFCENYRDSVEQLITPLY